MASCQLVLCTLAVLGSLIGEAWSLECYQCNSHNDSRCAINDNLPESLKAPCLPGKDKMCRKITQIVEFEMNGLPPDKRVIRGCGWDDSNYFNRCYQRSGFGGRQEVCSCEKDFCNAAAAPVAAAAVVLAAVVLMRAL